jgi:hypothetical protein
MEINYKLIYMEVKIIHSNKKEDRDFINNNQSLKLSFENIYNKWIPEMIKQFGKIRIRLPNLIEKYKSTLRNIDGKYYSDKSILMTSEDIFNTYYIFSVVILDNVIVAFGVGEIWSDCFYIKLVRSEIKGGCTKIIHNLINLWWDKEKLKFIPTESNNNPFIKLHVLEDNEPAKGCYKKFGFKMNGESLRNEKVMILTKESYIEHYLLPHYTNKLEARQNKY